MSESSSVPAGKVRVARVYVVEKPDGGWSVAISSTDQEPGVKAVISFRARERAERVAKAVADAIAFASPESEVLGP